MTRTTILQGLSAAALAALLVVTGCKPNQNTNQAAVAQQDANGPDPAAANMAPAGGSGQPTEVMGQNSSYAPQQQAESYPEGSDQAAYNNYDADQADQSTEPPPPLPEYDQPPAPDPDYLWTPGYWAWGPDGYYWVPGVWVAPPYYGALWTPPYWGWYGGHYLFHRGYWGPHVGFYGGIDYGFGYVGVGYYGGYWQGNNFYYNRAVNNVGNVGNYYNRPVVVNNVHYGAHPSNRVSYNGGNGGLRIAPRPQEVAAMHERHTAPIAAQAQVRQAAAANRDQSFAQNHGRPTTTAYARPEAVPAAAGGARGVEPNRPGAPAVNGRPAEVQRGAPGAPVAGHNVPMQQQRATAPQRAAPMQQPRAVEPQRAIPQQRPQEAARPQMAPRPEAAPRPVPEARQAPIMRTAPEARPAPAPRPAPAARPAPAPRPAPAAARPAPAPHPAAPAGHEEHR